MSQTPEAVRSAHARALPVMEEVQRYVRNAIRPMAADRGYLFIDRIKSADSLAEKLETGRYAKWSEIDDLYAATVVVPLAGHEDGVVNFLATAFEQRALRSRSLTPKDPTVFRFDGLRWYGVARPEAALGRQPGFGELVFEVQVITAFEWAWSKVTHDLVYKGGRAGWGQRRLAAHLKASVEQIELMIAGFEATSAQVPPSPWPRTDCADRVATAFQTYVQEGLIDEMSAPSSWGRFGDNVVAMVSSYARDRLNDSVDQLLSAIDADLRGSSVVLTSASCFQYVVEFIGREDTPGRLDKFRVVPSGEFALLRGRQSAFPREFEFDGVALPPS